MKHLNIRWNPATKEWFCTRCGRASDHISANDAHIELEQHECQVPTVEAPKAAPGSDTVRLMKKPFNMELKTERSGCRFAVATTDDGTERPPDF